MMARDATMLSHSSENWQKWKILKKKKKNEMKKKKKKYKYVSLECKCQGINHVYPWDHPNLWWIIYGQCDSVSVNLIYCSLMQSWWYSFFSPKFYPFPFVDDAAEINFEKVSFPSLRWASHNKVIKLMLMIYHPVNIWKWKHNVKNKNTNKKK